MTTPTRAPSAALLASLRAGAGLRLHAYPDPLTKARRGRSAKAELASAGRTTPALRPSRDMAARGRTDGDRCRPVVPALVRHARPRPASTCWPSSPSAWAGKRSPLSGARCWPTTPARPMGCSHRIGRSRWAAGPSVWRWRCARALRVSPAAAPLAPGEARHLQRPHSRLIAGCCEFAYGSNAPALAADLVWRADPTRGDRPRLSRHLGRPRPAGVPRDRLSGRLGVDLNVERVQLPGAEQGVLVHRGFLAAFD